MIAKAPTGIYVALYKASLVTALFSQTSVPLSLFFRFTFLPVPNHQLAIYPQLSIPPRILQKSKSRACNDTLKHYPLLCGICV